MIYAFEIGPVRQLTTEELAALDDRPGYPVPASGTISMVVDMHCPPSRMTINGLPWRVYFLLYLPKRLRRQEQKRRDAERREAEKHWVA